MSEDALDHRARARPRFGKKERRDYARKRHLEELLVPPSRPLAAWVTDPNLRPLRPPGKR